MATLRLLEPHARELGSADALESLYRVAHTGSDATFLRRAFAEGGTLEGVVDAAIGRFRKASGA